MSNNYVLMTIAPKTLFKQISAITYFWTLARSLVKAGIDDYAAMLEAKIPRG